MQFLTRRAAVSLNNIAVSLMERNDHSRAYETLKDALTLITKGDEHSHSIQEKMSRASKFLSRRSQDRELKISSIAVIPISDCPCVHLMVSSLSLGCRADSFKVNPMRIEAIDSESLLDQDQELLSVIMVYNYGICLGCASRAAFRSQDSRYIVQQDTCIQVLRIASNIVSRLCGDFFCDKDEDCRDAERTLSISFVVYNTFLQILQESTSSSSEEIEQVRARIACLKRALASLGEFTIYPSVKTAAAA
jgi:hypothetical protein